MNDPLDMALMEQTLRIGIADGLNNAADIVFADSQVIVPRDLGDLAATGQSPATSSDHEATPQSLEARITYGTPYAAAQHEGFALQERGGNFVLWVATQYTTPGTGRKFLETPLLAMAGAPFERVVGQAIQDELRKHYRET
jgi:hypothetical protein